MGRPTTNATRTSEKQWRKNCGRIAKYCGTKAKLRKIAKIADLNPPPPCLEAMVLLYRHGGEFSAAELFIDVMCHFATVPQLISRTMNNKPGRKEFAYSAPLIRPIQTAANLLHRGNIWRTTSFGIPNFAHCNPPPPPPPRAVCNDGAPWCPAVSAPGPMRLS